MVATTKKGAEMVAITKKRAVILARKGLPVVSRAKNSEKKREKAPLSSLKKSFAPLRKSKVRQTKHQISVMKRAGGTLKFAKKIRSLRKAKKSRIQLQNKAVLRSQKHAERAKAVAAVKGKADKNGKKKAPMFKKLHKYSAAKMRLVYKTQLAPRHLPAKNFFVDMKSSKRRRIPNLRKSLRPGTVCIMLGGRYRCKRVVFLKQLKRSGLCLITGPFGVNAVPLRRVSQNFLIATSIGVSMKDVKIPKHIKDSYFAKETVPKKKKTTEEDIFETKKTVKKGPTLQRKQDQKTVDRMIVHAIKQRKDKKVLLKYLKTDFGLMGTRYAHKLRF